MVARDDHFIYGKNRYFLADKKVFTLNLDFCPFLVQNTSMVKAWKLLIGSSQALCSSKLNYDVIIIFAMVENGGIEPKIMTLSQIYQEIWSILGF